MSKGKKTPSVWQRAFGKSIRKPVNKLAAVVVGKNSKARAKGRKPKLAEQGRQKNAVADTQNGRESHVNALKTSGRFFVCPLCQSVMLPQNTVLIRHFRSHGQDLSHQHVAELLRKQMGTADGQLDETASGESAG